MVVTRKKGGYKRTKQNPSLGRTTKSSGELASYFSSKDMRAEHSMNGPSLPRHDDPRSKTHNEVGFSLGPSLKIDTEGKPDATLFGKSDTLPGLAINKKKNAYSVRGKKIFARNSSSAPLLAPLMDPRPPKVHPSSSWPPLKMGWTPKMVGEVSEIPQVIKDGFRARIMYTMR
nr:hypothetical protein CFP56_26817 [Quercus suber]